MSVAAANATKWLRILNPISQPIEGCPEDPGNPISQNYDSQMRGPHWTPFPSHGGGRRPCTGKWDLNGIQPNGRALTVPFGPPGIWEGYSEQEVERYTVLSKPAACGTNSVLDQLYV